MGASVTYRAVKLRAFNASLWQKQKHFFTMKRKTPGKKAVAYPIEVTKVVAIGKS